MVQKQTRHTYSLLPPGLEISPGSCSSLSGFMTLSTAARSAICWSMWKKLISRFQYWKMFPESSETLDFGASTLIYSGSSVGLGLFLSSGRWDAASRKYSTRPLLQNVTLSWTVPSVFPYEQTLSLEWVTFSRLRENLTLAGGGNVGPLHALTPTDELSRVKVRCQFWNVWEPRVSRETPTRATTGWECLFALVSVGHYHLKSDYPKRWAQSSSIHCWGLGF